MKALIITLIVWMAIESLGRICYLFSDYPRHRKSVGPGHDAAELIIFLGFIFWGAIVLAWG